MIAQLLALALLAVSPQGTAHDEVAGGGNLPLDGSSPMTGDLDMNENDIIDPLNIYQAAPTTDLDPDDLRLQAAHAYSQGTQTAANLILGGGIDEKFFTSTDYANSNTDTLTIAVGNCAAGVCAVATTTFTESTDWDCDVTSDIVCACALYDALIATPVTGVTAQRTDGTCSDAKVFIQPTDASTYSVVIAAADTGGGGVWGTATNGTDGNVVMPHALLLPDGAVGAPSWAWSSDADGTGTGMYRGGADAIWVSINNNALARFFGTQLQMLGASTAIDMAAAKIYSSSGALPLGTTCAAAGATGDWCSGANGQVDGTLQVAGVSSVAGAATTALINTKSVLATVTFPGGGAASQTAGGLIPATGAFVVGFSSRVVTTGTTCAGMRIGTAADPDLFGEDLGITDNNTSDMSSATAAMTALNPALAATDIVVAGTDGGGTPANCVDLVVDLVVTYMDTTAATADQ